MHAYLAHEFIQFFSFRFSSEVYDECDALFESLVALEEFCKELAAIAFVKYHHATE